MHQRNFISAAGLLIGSALGRGKADAAAVGGGRDKVAPRLLKAFLSLPGEKSAQIDVDAPRHPWRIGHQPDALLFCGSCFKTFVLTTFLQEVETGRLSESDQIDINNNIRSVGGGVFDFLTGTASARTVLEAMISHSDNTATDAAMSRVGVDKVRAFLLKAGLTRLSSSAFRRWRMQLSLFLPIRQPISRAVASAGMAFIAWQRQVR